MKKYYLPFILLFILLSSCNKNQHKVNKIAGKWAVTEITLNGVEYENPYMDFEFDNCKLKKDGYCEFKIQDYNSFETTYGIYNITHKGKQLNMSIFEGLEVQNYSFEIKRLNDQKLILVNLNAQPGTFERIEMEIVQ